MNKIEGKETKTIIDKLVKMGIQENAIANAIGTSPDTIRCLQSSANQFVSPSYLTKLLRLWWYLTKSNGELVNTSILQSRS